jgi:hypothetical protein
VPKMGSWPRNVAETSQTDTSDRLAWGTQSGDSSSSAATIKPAQVDEGLAADHPRPPEPCACLIHACEVGWQRVYTVTHRITDRSSPSLTCLAEASRSRLWATQGQCPILGAERERAASARCGQMRSAASFRRC